ncbi:MAG: glycosyltransferase, partial [Candidatus Electrothrix sp. AR3]|nr:glycosyltransferase [Candidatus Electrothrix sp. AR3]
MPLPLSRKTFPTSLFWSGRLVEAKRVKESLLHLNAPERIIRLQGLSENELQTLYQEAALFILPSSYEGFGLPVVEAMMAGLPVLTVHMASLPEVGGKYAFYVDTPESSLLSKKILEIFELPRQEAAQRVSQGQQWAKSFTWGR